MFKNQEKSENSKFQTPLIHVPLSSPKFRPNANILNLKFQSYTYPINVCLVYFPCVLFMHVRVMCDVSFSVQCVTYQNSTESRIHKSNNSSREHIMCYNTSRTEYIYVHVFIRTY